VDLFYRTMHYRKIRFEFAFEFELRDGTTGVTVKTILVLEDEPILLSLLRLILRRSGYSVLEAGDAEEALRKFHLNNRNLDLVIADVNLPSSSGIQVALVLRAELPDLRVILTSGYPATTWNPRDSADLWRLGPDSVRVLQKPFRPLTLLNTVRELTAAPQSELARAART
jgi:CheY-like chemotaxis protein